MESGMRAVRCHRGFLLITVLVITAVGLLFGAGALLLFRFQCQLRIDRQHELEKVYAVRSALNVTRTNLQGIPDEGNAYRYRTGSGRDLGLLVRPVEPIFPSTNYFNAADNMPQRHFTMERGDFSLGSVCRGDNCIGFYNTYFDYECGASGVTNLLIRDCSYTNDKGINYYELQFYDTNATYEVKAKWWINIGMSGTGGWLQEMYGRRYYLLPKEYIGNTANTKDIIRLGIIRNVTNDVDAGGKGLTDGCRRGWPLSQENERALVLQVQPLAESGGAGANKSRSEIKLSEYAYPLGETQRLLCLTSSCHLCNLGIQLAHTNVWVFYVENERRNDVVAEDLTPRGYQFLGSANLTPETYRYFAKEQKIGGKLYAGVSESSGGIKAPELRAVIEVVGASNERTENGVVTKNTDKLTLFRVTPAYQYDVFLEHPLGTEPKRATVAQKTGKFGSDASNYTILTYDTHGTENKGFRKDEREAERKRGIR